MMVMLESLDVGSSLELPRHFGSGAEKLSFPTACVRLEIPPWPQARSWAHVSGRIEIINYRTALIIGVLINVGTKSTTGGVGY